MNIYQIMRNLIKRYFSVSIDDLLSEEQLIFIRGIWNQYDSINHTIDKILCFTQFHFGIVMAFAYDNTVS